ncbi:DUF456 domain-containing protein [uncultured Planktosalinus sp.]|uniref:DUF456 domain-containing protein n=1 Tax=uncultured Planktosalinus sp. TaxID=1810935 RepID=UPI0030DC24AB
MDLFLLFVSLLLVLLGIAGSFLPVIPGPVTGWLGLLVFHLTKAVPLNYTFLTITFIVAMLIFILDYIIPAMGTKRFGGSRYGMIGATLGLIVGILAPIPFGVIIGPFVGAFLGELLNTKTRHNALRAAFGSFIGFLASTFMKFFVSMVFLGLFIWKTIVYWESFF